MLLFGLAWVASLISTGISSNLVPNDLPGAAEYFPRQSEVMDKGAIAGSSLASFPVVSLPAASVGGQELSAPGFMPVSALEPASAPAWRELQSVARPPLGNMGRVAWVTLPLSRSALSLWPNWLSTQNGILDFAHPLVRWLTAAGSDSSAHRHNHLDAIAPDSLKCFSQASQETTAYRDVADWIRNCLLGQHPNSLEAEALTKRLEATLRAAHWQGDKILPTLAENLPAAKIGDRLLFIVTPEISEAMGVNGEVVATQWVNELRLALGAAPLDLVESQIHMHGLEPTGEYLSGEASWYGPYFQGRLTATGEIFDKAMFTAAHKELPFNTYLKVTNLETGYSLIVRINDRGPYVGDRILDLSQGSAQYLGSPEIGVVPVRAEFMEPKSRLRASLPYRAVGEAQPPIITMWRP